MYRNSKETRESITARNKSSEPHSKNRISELMVSSESVNIKHSPVRAHKKDQNNEIALNYRQNQLRQKVWKSLMYQYVFISHP
jgi:hypothetical protein